MFTLATPILAYHQITTETPPADLELAMSVDKFAGQMRYLHENGFVCYSLSDIFQSSDGKTAQRRRSFALTFDDGYENFYTLACPILRDYGFTATIFLITGRIFHRDDPRREADKRYLNWEQVKELDGWNFSFGSHTCSHRNLTSLPRDEIEAELTASKRFLEDGLGKPVEWLAYPFGESNIEVQKMTEEAGYRAAFGGVRGRSSQFDVRRQFCRRDDSLAEFSFRLNRFQHYVQVMRDETALGQFARKIKRRLRAAERVKG